MKSITRIIIIMFWAVLISGYMSILAAATPTSLLANFNAINAAYSVEREDPYIEDKAEKQHSASFIRLGFGVSGMINPYDTYLKDLQDKKWGLLADIYFYRLRSNHGNGIDFYTRFMYRSFAISEKKAKNETDLLYYKNNYHAFSGDLGIRGIYGFYFWHELWQLYIQVAPRFIYYRGEFSKGKNLNKDKVLNFYSIGIIGGIGIEITLVSLCGIFAEYNLGYCPVGSSKRNIEGHQVYAGITLRTQLK